MIDGLVISGINNDVYYNGNNLIMKYLPGVNKINILIGENNSGKSRLMRFLIREDIVKILSNSYLTKLAKDQVKEKRRLIIRNIDTINMRNSLKLELIENIEESNDVDFFINISNLINIKEQEIDLKNLDSFTKSAILEIKNGLETMFTKLSSNSNHTQKSVLRLQPVYIPILRGIENYNIYFNIEQNKEILNTISMNQRQRDSLEVYKDNSKHIYENKIQKVYNIPKDIIFTAENLYDEITSKLLGEEEGRTFIRDFQDFMSEQFYNGKEFTIIPQRNRGYLNVKIDAQEKPLHDLGDGIKQLITMLYKIFEYRNKEKLFFIEEPEQNLHPGFQRKFLEILQLPMFNKHQYFITTHSNHLIDSCFDYKNISIYKFVNINNSNNKFKVIKTSSNDTNILQLLGVNNSSVFMANCTIWVEGISDKILIRRYLEMHFEKNNIKNLKEDINYSFVEYGGNNIDHWSFIADDDIGTINSSGITNRSFIICDNDNDSKNKKERKKKLKKIFGENYCELTVREIENTISKKTLNKMFFGDSEVKYKKYFEQKEYMNKSTYMGKFIDEHYDLTRKYSFSKGTGTIINKSKFSKEAIQNINSYEDLTIQAQNLCKRIVKFIIESNNF